MNAKMTGLLLFAAFPLAGIAANNAVLEEIVVTAQKREQGLQEVPISVARISDENIRAMFSGGDDILTLASRAPGLYAESSNGRGAPRFYIRGLGNVDFDLAASQPVSVMMDDVVMENVVLKSFPLFDLDNVEVIRGPQGTLFGRNTTAGIVKFDTAKPTIERDGYATLTMGNLGTQILQGAWGGSLSSDDRVTGRFSLLHNSRDDWVDNNLTGQGSALGAYDDFAFRGQLGFQVNDDLSALLSYQHRDLDGSSSFFRANVFTTGQDGLNDNYDRETVFYDDGDGNRQDIDQDGFTLKVKYDQDDFTFESITSYQDADYASKGDIDGGNPAGPGFIPFQAVTEDQATIEQLTQEFRVIGVRDRMTWQTGMFFFDSELDVTTIDGFFGQTTVTHKNEAWAVFGQVAYDVSDQLTITGGVRYTDDEKSLTVGEQNVNGFALVIGAAAVQAYPKIVETDEQTSWELSANYEINEDSSMFARIADGFRAQSIQARDVAFEGLPSIADSETIQSFEVGYKAEGLNGRARFNGAVYWYQVDDLQLSAIGGANNGNSLLNADKGAANGLELDLEVLVTDNLLVTAGFGLANTELEDSSLTTVTCGSLQCTPTDPVVGTDGAGVPIVNIDGNPFQASPSSTFNFTARYGLPTESGEYYALVDYARQGETQMALYEAEEFETEDQFEVGLRIAYRSNSGYEFGIFARNLTDEDNVKGFIDFNNNTGFVNEPRIVGVDFRYDFY